MASFQWPPSGGSGGGVTSLNTLTGALTLAAGANITVTASGGDTLTVATANQADNTLLGNISGGSAAPTALTGTQVNTILPLFSSTLKGLTPLSGGGTVNFLRADGTWAVPPGSGGSGMAIGAAVTSGTSGSILWVDGSTNLAQDNSNFFWDASNKYLGLQTKLPKSVLHINESGKTQSASIVTQIAALSTGKGAWFTSETYPPQITFIGASAAANAPGFLSTYARGTLASPTAVATGDVLFQLGAFGWDGTTFPPSAIFSAAVNGTVTGGHVPTDFRFSTGDGTTQFNTLSLTSAGRAGILTQAPSCEFHVVGNARVTGLSTAGLVHNDTSGNLTASQLVNADVSSSAAIAYSKLAPLSTGQVLLGNAGTPTATTLSGDVTVGATGVTAIGAGKVTNAMLATKYTAKGDLVTGSGTNTSSVLAVGNDGKVLTGDSGSGNGVSWQSPVANFFAPAVEMHTSNGSGTYNLYYGFVMASGSATVGATYTDSNSTTFTVYQTVASSTQVIMSGSVAPVASGTLTKASGTGSSSLTYSLVIAPKYLRVIAQGPGGGGGGSCTAGGNNGGSALTGSATTFGSSLITANPGAGGTGTSQSAPGAGGTATVSSPAVGMAVQGGGGSGAMEGATYLWIGGAGGASVIGSGGGQSVNNNSTAYAGKVGGGGGGAGAPAGGIAGKGGGAGGYCNAIIPSPSATYAWVVGSFSNGGALGTGGSAGGDGGPGLLQIEAYFQ